MPTGFSKPDSAFLRGYSRVGTPRHPERWIQPAPLLRPIEIPDATRTAAMVNNVAPRIPWDEFLGSHFVWRRTDDEGNPSGEHIAMIGPTGQGKTTLTLNLFPLHPFTVVFGTKKTDSSLDKFVKSGFMRQEHWQSLDARHFPRRIIWPQPRKLSDMVPYQRQVFTDAIEHIYAEGHWDLVIDEGYYLDEVLKLGGMLRLIYTQIRSAGVSIVLGTQRPAWVPVEVYDQSTHLFFWRDNDKRNLQRLQEVSLIHAQAIKEIVPNLENHQVLYLNTRTGFMCRTRCPAISFPKGGEQE